MDPTVAPNSVGAEVAASSRRATSTPKIALAKGVPNGSKPAAMPAMSSRRRARAGDAEPVGDRVGESRRWTAVPSRPALRRRGA